MMKMVAKVHESRFVPPLDEYEGFAIPGRNCGGLVEEYKGFISDGGKRIMI